MKIKGNHLKEWGLPHGKVYAIALQLLNGTGVDRTVAESLIKGIIKSPEKYLEGPYAPIAQELIKQDTGPKTHRLLDKCVPTKVYGQEMIEGGALHQIYTAAKLPVAVQAAIMPDGHQGYGLPIGGVLATDNCVIPYAVGVDIGCRMHMTVTDIPAKNMAGMHGKLVNVLTENTVFGAGQETHIPAGHEVLNDERFQTIPCVKKARLIDKAVVQIGTSGSGNHFVEFGRVELPNMEPRLAILSHSGSRAVGFQIAKLYTQIALDTCKLQKDARHLAWLSLDDENGQEYWEAMNLAGDFARACHEVIHARLVKALKASVERTIQNHHNFAWKQTLPDGREVIVHRKGATPAGQGEIGLIPGSMASYSYIVEGKGNPDSMCSSSHGAGRAMSRKAAKEQFTMSWMRADLKDKGVTLIGGDVDECRGGYKDIEAVMPCQADLVDIVGRFMPYIVRMAGEDKKPWEPK